MKFLHLPAEYPRRPPLSRATLPGHGKADCRHANRRPTALVSRNRYRRGFGYLTPDPRGRMPAYSPPSISPEGIDPMRVLMLVADGFEDVELFHVVYRLREEGAEVTIASPRTTAAHRICTATASSRTSRSWRSPPRTTTCSSSPAGSSPERPAAPRGRSGRLRAHLDAGGSCPVCTISHGPQLLISAGCARRPPPDVLPRHPRRRAGSPTACTATSRSIVSGNLVSCRSRDDLPHLMGRLLESIEQRVG